MSKHSSKAKTLVKNTLWIYLSKGITQLFGLLSNILVIKKLEVDMFGTFNFVLGQLVLFNIFSSSPVIDVFNRYIPELFQNKQYGKMRKLVLSGTIIASFATIVMMLVIYLVQKPFSNFFNIPGFSAYLFSFFVFIVSNLFRAIISAVLATLLLHKQSSMLTMLSSFTRSLLYIVFLPKLEVSTLLYIEAISTIIYFVPGIFVLWKFYYSIDRTQDSVASIDIINKKRMTRFGFFSFFNQVGAGIVGKSSDYYIISAMSNQVQVGMYGFAYRIFDMFQKFLPISEFLTVLRPLFFQKFTDQENKDSLVKIYNFIVKIMIPIFTLPSIYLLIFGKPIISIVFDPKYLDAYIITCVVLATNIILAVYFPLTLVIQLKEKMEVALYSKIILFVTIPASIISMKYYGILGVAIATSFGELFKNVFMYYYIKRTINIKYQFQTFRNYILVFGLTVIVLMPFDYLYNSVSGLIIGSILFAILSIYLLVVLHPFDKEDLGILERFANTSKLTSKIIPFVLTINRFKPSFLVKKQNLIE